MIIADANTLLHFLILSFHFLIRVKLEYTFCYILPGTKGFFSSVKNISVA